MRDHRPSAPRPVRSFEASGESIVRAVGFAPELSSARAGWNGVAFYAWRGQCREAAFEPFDEPVIVYHVGGAPKVPVRIGRRWDQETHPGRVTIIPPSTPVGWDIRGEVYSRSVHLSPEWFAAAAGEGGPVPAVTLRCGVDDPVLLSGVQALEGELRQPTQQGTLYADSVASFLAEHLLHGPATDRPATAPHLRNSLSGPNLQRVLERLEAGIETGVSLRALAAEAQLSPGYFSTAFRGATGRTPHRYLTHRRLAHARVLLRESRMSIADVALRCGFSSQAHFTQYFHREHGVTPKAFRRDISP